MDYKPKKSETVDLSKIVAEAQKYEIERDRMERCGQSSVQSVNCIVLNGILHSGVVSHVCTRPVGHDGECRCCGYSWKSR